MCCAAGSHHDLDVEYGEHDNSSPVCWLERFPYKEDVIGSSPVGPTPLGYLAYAGIAQLVEQGIENPCVASSSLALGSFGNKVN